MRAIVGIRSKPHPRGEIGIECLRFAAGAEPSPISASRNRHHASGDMVLACATPNLSIEVAAASIMSAQKYRAASNPCRCCQFYYATETTFTG